MSWAWLIAGYALFLSSPGRLLIAATARRVLLGGLAPGRYPRRGWAACRVWFVDHLGEVLNVGRLGGTPWAPRLARILGAEVGADVRLATLPPPTARIRIGDGATVEAHVDARGWWVEGQELVLGELVIGAGARVGARTVLMPGAEIGEGAEVEPGSVVSTAVPAGERWAGSPARHVGPAGVDWPDRHPAPPRRRRRWRVMWVFSVLALEMLLVVSAMPALLVVGALVPNWDSIGAAAGTVIAAAPLIATTFIASEAVISALLFRAVQRLVRPGWHADEGVTGWALWFSDALQTAAGATLFALYASVFTRPWLRLHGIRLGRRTEVSTAQGLGRWVSFGETSFVADAPLFACSRAHRGWIHVAPIEVGDRSFVGNGALLTGGTRVGDDCLIGIETMAPEDVPDGSSWLGCPPIELPRVPDPADPSRTVDPPRRLWLARAATEVVRIVLPSSVSLVLGTLVLWALTTIGAAAGAVAVVGAAPFVILAGALVAALFTIAAKWVLMGRYRPGEHPLWSSFVWRDEIINTCQEQLAGQWLLIKALGTPLIPPYMRAMGAKVGRDVWLETMAVTEFDVVTIGDGCAINRYAVIETHLFHDRLMRIGPAEMAAGSTLGPESALLLDARLGEGCVVGGRSVVLRGEELPAGTRWHGVPVSSA